MFLSNDFANAWLIVSQLLRTFAAVLTMWKNLAACNHIKNAKTAKTKFPIFFSSDLAFSTKK